jgi:hypothetical protein
MKMDDLSTCTTLESNKSQLTMLYHNFVIDKESWFQ